MLLLRGFLAWKLTARDPSAECRSYVRIEGRVAMNLVDRAPTYGMWSGTARSIRISESRHEHECMVGSREGVYT